MQWLAQTAREMLDAGDWLAFDGVGLDGKTLRRSYDKASSKAALHMVSAWATVNHISLGQTLTDAKSNEITAIPRLLKMIECAGSLVTIDAMGCQTEIAKQILDGREGNLKTVNGDTQPSARVKQYKPQRLRVVNTSNSTRRVEIFVN